MDPAALQGHLSADAARLRDIAARHPTAPVPTCPDWTVDDLVRHVANIYQNIVVPRLRLPDDVPKQDLAGVATLDAFDRGYAAMTTEFTTRDPLDHTGREAYETVYFWIRRMAHETAVHRVDAELAAADPTPVPAALALDGIDEMMTAFLEPVTHLWPEEFAADLGDWGGRWVLVAAGDAVWRVTVRPDGAAASRDGTADGGTAASVRGAPDPLLRWLYNRGGADQVVVDGDGALVAQLRRLLTAVMNTG